MIKIGYQENLIPKSINAASQVFRNNNLMKHIYEFDNTYHLIYQDILDDCYSTSKNFWNKKNNNILCNDYCIFSKFTESE